MTCPSSNKDENIRKLRLEIIKLEQEVGALCIENMKLKELLSAKGKE